MLDQWNDRLFTIIVDKFVLYIVRDLPNACRFGGNEVRLLNNSMSLCVLCYCTEGVPSLGQWENQIHQLTLGSPEPI